LVKNPSYKSGGGRSGKCLETGEVTISLCGMKNSNHRHLLITVEYNRWWGLKVLNPDLPTKVN
jgi:hypothetical protein